MLRCRILIVIFASLCSLCILAFSAEARERKRFARTAPSFTGCTRIILREYDKSQKVYMRYPSSIDLFTYTLSAKSKQRLAYIVRSSAILSKAVPASTPDPLGHFKEFYFEFGPHSRWTVRVESTSVGPYQPLISFMNRHGRRMNGR